MVWLKRPFCVMGGSFLVGSFVASLLPEIAQILVCITGILGCLVCLLLLADTPKKNTYASVCFFFGMAVGLFVLSTVPNKTATAHLADTHQTITAQITDIEQRSNHRYTYYITVQPDGDDIFRAFPTVLYSDVYLEADYYDFITLPVLFSLPTDTQSFDSVRYYQSKGIYILCYFSVLVAEGVEVPNITIQTPEHQSLLYHTKKLGEYLGQRVDEMFPSEAASMVKALVLGDRSALDFTLKESYVSAGTAHLFTISGIHISILAGFLAFLCSKSRRYLWIRVVVQIVVLTGFVFLTGMRLSAIRAVLMIFIFLSGQLVRRRVDPLNSLCMAGFLIVLWDAHAILDLGFLMSFGATLGIVLCSGRLQHFICESFSLKKRWQRSIVMLLSLSFSTNLFVLPIYVLEYQTFSTVFWASNLICTATAGIMIVLGFVILILLLLPTPWIILTFVCFLQTQLIALQNIIATFFGRLPFATVGLESEITQLSFGICAVLVCCSLYLRKNYNTTKPMIMLCSLVFLFGNLLSVFLYKDVVYIAIIGDGNVSNVIVMKGSHAVVISSKDNNNIDERTYRYLKTKGIVQIDSLVLLYDQFRLYEDTYRLVENLPVSNVQFNRYNTVAAELLADKTKASLYPIGAGGGVQLQEDVEISFDYYDQAIDVTIRCRNVVFFLTDHIATLQQIPTNVALIRGLVREPLQRLNTDHTVLLEKQREPILADMAYDNAALQAVEFAIPLNGFLQKN